MQFRSITYGSKEYQETLKLRNKVMRRPLGFNIYEEDFSSEKASYIIGAFKDQYLTGVGIINSKLNQSTAKIEYLCVDNDIQSKGIGSSIIRKLENIAKQNNNQKIKLEARYSAKGFYQKHNYRPIGSIYKMKIAPINHIKMEKDI